MEDLYPTTMEAINKIIIEFPCHHQLAAFINEFEEWREYKAKLERKAFDNRGNHTREFHRRARVFQALHPMFSHRECYKIANERR